MQIDLHNKKSIGSLLRGNRDFPLAFTSGCFDLMHSGHIYLLSEIRKMLPKEARLLVAIHSDAQVKKHKGVDRPIFSAEHRQLLLDNIKGVDYVGIWDGWEDIVDLVFDLGPDFLATTKDQVQRGNWDNGWQEVAKKLSAELVVIDRIAEDISTSRFIEKIRHSKN